MNVMIGIDTLKASHTTVAISRDEDQIASVKMRAIGRPVDQLLTWAEPFEKRTGPSNPWPRDPGAGHGRSNKNDPNDAHSIAVAALRAPALRSVEPADQGEVLRLLSKRNSDLGRQRSRVVCRLHSLFAELSPGRNRQGNVRLWRRGAPGQGAARFAGPADALRPRPRAPRRRASPR